MLIGFREILLAKRREDHAAVVQLCKDALESDPDDVLSHYYMAQAYEALGELDLAVRTLDTCIELSPDAFEYLAAAAQWLAKSDRHREANHYAEKALLQAAPEQLPRMVNLFLKGLSFLFRRKTTDVNQQNEGSYSRKMDWLREYTRWYQRKE